MAQIKTSDFKNGMTLEIDGQLFDLVEFQHVKPGKGSAFVRTKLKNLSNGAVTDKTFRAGERVERAILDTREMQLLYEDGDGYVFMDLGNYEQVTIDRSTVGDKGDYLAPNATVEVMIHDETFLGIDLPASVALEIAETEPGMQGDRVSGARKPATLETGKVVQVPLFVEPGEKILVDTRTGEYLSRS